MGYRKDGVEYAGGPFGGDVQDAVRGVPEAESEAGAYASDATASTIVLAADPPVFALAAVANAAWEKDPGTRSAIDYGVLGGAVAVLVIGLVLHQKAILHLVNGANVFNDAHSAHAQDTAGGPGRPGSAGAAVP